MHVARVVRANDADNESSPSYLPHRAYPTVQFHKTDGGVYRTPSLISLWVYLDMPLVDRPTGQIDDWFSFITVTPDTSDHWARTVLVNVGPDELLRLVHVPSQGEQEYTYHDTTVTFPQREWVRLDLYLDLRSEPGTARLWQNGTRIGEAEVRDAVGGLAQAHFGLYASAAVASGVIYNDHLRIVEVRDEAHAQELVDAPY